MVKIVESNISKAEYLALGFGVDADQLEIVPHLL